MPNKIDIDGVEARIEKLCGDYEAAWHAVWAEETRSLVRTILRHRRATATPPRPSDACCPNGSNGASGRAR